MNNQNEITFSDAQIGSVRLHYAKCGDGEKLVLLLHGFPEFWYSWRHQLVALGDEYTVVAPDLRGYNLSDKPARVEDYEISKLVDDVTGLIHHFGREKAAVIGHDWGAVIAWAVAQRHPEAIWKLGAMQVPPTQIWRQNQTLKQFAASWYMFFFQIPFVPEWLLSRNDFALLENALKNSTAKKDVFTPEIIAEYKKSWREPFVLQNAINYYRANILKRFFAKQTTDKKIKVPTLFIYGELDTAVLPETVRGIGEVIDAPYEEFHIPGAGHWIQQEEPETVTQILREFLAGKDV